MFAQKRKSQEDAAGASRDVSHARADSDRPGFTNPAMEEQKKKARKLAGPNVSKDTLMLRKFKDNDKQRNR